MNPVLLLVACIANGLMIAAWLSLVMPPSIFIDEQTGCQYLKGGLGSLEPRIGADFMQVGCKGVEGDN